MYASLFTTLAFWTLVRAMPVDVDQNGASTLVSETTDSPSLKDVTKATHPLPLVVIISASVIFIAVACYLFKHARSTGDKKAASTLPVTKHQRLTAIRHHSLKDTVPTVHTQPHLDRKVTIRWVSTTGVSPSNTSSTNSPTMPPVVAPVIASPPPARFVQLSAVLDYCKSSNDMPGSTERPPRSI